MARRRRQVAAQDEAPSCGTEPVELLAYFETGFPFQQALADEFTKQFPNVTWNIREDQFANLMPQTPRLLASDNPPDLIRLPTMVDLVQDGLLLNLEPYVTAYGWDQWPAVAARPASGRRRRPTARRGRPLRRWPQLLDDRRLLQQGAGRADRHDRAAGDARGVRGPAGDGQGGWSPAHHAVECLRPAAAASPSRSRTSWPRSVPTTPINEWIYQKEGATIDTPSNLEAAQHLEQWIKDGLLPRGRERHRVHRFERALRQGEGVFTFNGDWQNAQYDTDAPGKIGFFLFPPAEAGGGQARCPRRVTFGIAAKAKHADCAAFFLDWVATNPDSSPDQRGRRRLQPRRPVRPAHAEGRRGLGHERDAGGLAVVAAENGLMDFIANATGDIFTGSGGWTPELQKLVGGQQTPEGLLQTVQASYEEDLAPVTCPRRSAA